MSIISQVRAIIDSLDGRQFTISDFECIWKGLNDTDSKRVYKAVGTCLNKLKNHHAEIKALGKDALPHSNGKRSVVYQACDIEEAKEIKEAFSNRSNGFYFNPKLNDIFVNADNH